MSHRQQCSKKIENRLYIPALQKCVRVCAHCVHFLVSESAIHGTKVVYASLRVTVTRKPVSGLYNHFFVSLRDMA